MQFPHFTFSLLMVFNLIISNAAINAQSIESSLYSLLKESYTPGITLTTIENGKISDSFHLGYKSTDSKSPVTSSTVFSAASLSKCVFGYIVIQLADEGLIDLNTPLNDYFIYEDINHDERAATVTGKMVLSHTTGLPNWRSGKLEFRNDPGDKFGYSGEGYVWLQKVIEHITESDLESLAQKMVFQPLGMNRTSYVFLDQFDDDYALPHDNMLMTNSKFKIAQANAAHSLQ
ncbi:MAG: serine hydrolase, partial [Saprospiraceae bacterium]|nr:serine hydrolase [Saprospiraceae bacterium]